MLYDRAEFTASDSRGTAPLGSRRMAIARVADSGEDRLDPLAVDVGQAHVAAAPTVGQPLVVHAQQVEHGRVQVVDLAPALDHLVAVLVRGPVSHPALDAPTGQPDAVPERIVVTSVGPLRERGPSELAGEAHRRRLQ